MESKTKTNKVDRNEIFYNLLKILELANYMVKEPGRTIFVIGAGASSPVAPLASELKNQLTSTLKDELERILVEKGIVPNISEATLEQILSAYIEFTRDEKAVFRYLKPRIPSITDSKRPPLGYEILSHFVACGLVHYIISLNFDELLEKSMDNNVGNDNYENVRSKSAFGRLVDFGLLDDIRKFKMKAVFKPHGTISYPMTLRPTFDTIQRLEDEKYEVLRAVLEVAEVIVFVGYGFRDPDIQGLFLPVMLERKENPAIYFVTKSGSVRNNPKAQSLISFRKSNPKFNLLPEPGFIIMESNKFFRKLSKAIFDTCDFFKELETEKSKVSITLSEDQEKYLKDKEKELSDKGRSYPKVYGHRVRDILFERGVGFSLEDKILVELIIFALKTRGKFKESALAEVERVRNYMKNYMEEEGSIENLLNKLVKNEIFLLPEEKTLPGQKVYYCLGKNEEEAVTNIIEKLKQMYPELKNIPQNVEERLKILMINLTRDFDYNLGEDLGNAPFFKRPQILLKREDFDKKTGSILTSSKKIKVIAETGEWLTGRAWQKFISNKEIELIISDYNEDPEKSFHRHRAIKVIKDLLEITQKGKLDIWLLPFRDNKHHMTIGNNKALYFYREGKSVLWTPIYVENDDCKILLDYFEIAKEKAELLDLSKF